MAIKYYDDKDVVVKLGGHTIAFSPDRNPVRALDDKESEPPPTIHFPWPGVKAKLVNHSGTWVLMVRMVVKERETGEELELAQQWKCPGGTQSMYNSGTREPFWQWVRACLLELIHHEVDEMLVVGAIQPRNPHDENRPRHVGYSARLTIAVRKWDKAAFLSALQESARAQAKQLEAILGLREARELDRWADDGGRVPDV